MNIDTPLNKVKVMEPYVNSYTTQMSLLGLQDLLEDKTVKTIEVTDDTHLVPVRNDQQIDIKSSVDLSTSILNDMQKHELMELLAKHEGAFARHSMDIGIADVPEQVIRLKEGAIPHRSRPYPVAESLKPVLKKQIDDLLEAGIIVPSTAPNFISPIIMVKKPDGSWRLVIDYRKLNENTVKTHQILPTIPDVANILAHKRYFTSLDLASGYWQIGLSMESQDLTTFITPDLRLFKQKSCPFGSQQSPACFQRVMNAVLADFITAGEVICYVDDILLASKTFEEHLNLLDRVLERMRSRKLKLKLKKAAFCQKELKYLGHIITEHGYAPSPENTARLVNYPSPTNLRELQRIVGLLSYYRRHVRDFSKHAAPMLALTRKGRKYEWTEECERSLRFLIERVTSSPILRFPLMDGKSPFTLTTDASGISVAAALAQIQDGVEHPIAFFSKSLNDAERRWASAEMEVAAIVTGINAFRQYLLGNKFTVYTDNAACVHILKKANLSPKLYRWAAIVQEYDMVVKHKQGKQNTVCDALSRVRVSTIRQIPPRDDIRLAQRRDLSLNPIIRYLLHDETPVAYNQKQREKFIQECQQFEMIDGMLFKRRLENSPVVVIPDMYQELMLYRLHKSVEGMHLGITKTLKTLSEMCWWNGMRKAVEDYVNSCDSCAQIKNPYRRIRVPMKGQYPQHALQTVSCDLAGPFPVSKRGNKWFIVFVDHFTKYCEIVALPDARTETVAQAFVEQWVTRYGLPTNLLHDRGTNLVSAVMKRVSEMMGIKQKTTCAYNPRCNGLSEHCVKTIKFCLAHVVNEEHTDWDESLHFIQMAMNSSWHASTNSSPAKLFYGREMMTPTRMLLPGPPTSPVKEGEYPEMMEKRMQKIWQAARERMKIAKEAQKYYYDLKVVPSNIDVGDRVYKHSPRGKLGRATKLLHHWIGPYIVTKVNETNAWIRPMSKPHEESDCVHLNRLKKYCGNNNPPEDTEVSDGEDEGELGERIDAEADEQQADGNGDGDDDGFPRTIETDIQDDEIEREEQMVHNHGLRRQAKRRVDPDYIYY